MKQTIFKTPRTICYYENGKRHRTTGPATKWKGIVDIWAFNGVTHRCDGPAIVWANGGKEWWLNGRCHRVDGPAVEYSSGHKEWYNHGLLHRTNGPALEFSNGSVAWFINGVDLTDQINDWFITTGFNPDYNNWSQEECMQFKLIWG